MMWEGIKESGCPGSSERNCLKEKGGLDKLESQWGMSIGFGHIWIPDHLDKRSFGGVVGKEAQVEKLKERIIDGEEMTVTVDNYLKCLAVQKGRNMGQYMEGNVWSVAGFLKEGHSETDICSWGCGWKWGGEDAKRKVLEKASWGGVWGINEELGHSTGVLCPWDKREHTERRLKHWILAGQWIWYGESEGVTFCQWSVRSGKEKKRHGGIWWAIGDKYQNSNWERLGSGPDTLGDLHGCWKAAWAVDSEQRRILNERTRRHLGLLHPSILPLRLSCIWDQTESYGLLFLSSGTKFSETRSQNFLSFRQPWMGTAHLGSGDSSAQ